jgi:four helix bundle protein
MLKSYKELKVWQRAFELVIETYQVTKQLPKSEQFGLSSQLQRAATSIPSNIAEGHGRHNLKEYRQFLGIARGSSCELETQLLLAQAIYNADVQTALSLVTEVQKMLQALCKKLIPET